jgi:hypothetical protein
VITVHQEQHNTATSSGVCSCTFKPQHHQMLLWLTHWPEHLRLYTQSYYLWCKWTASDFIRVPCFFIAGSFIIQFILWTVSSSGIRCHVVRWVVPDVPPKLRVQLNGLHGVISQKMILFITTAVKTSNPTIYSMFTHSESQISLMGGWMKFNCKNHGNGIIIAITVSHYDPC